MSMSPFYRKMRVKETAHVEKLATKTVLVDTTLQAEDSGKVIFVGPTGVDIILPDPPFDGCNFTFILKSNNVTTKCTIKCNATGEFFAGCVATATHDSTVDSAIFDGSTHDAIDIATTAEQGDWLHVISDGSTWFVSGFSSLAASFVAATS